MIFIVSLVVLFLLTIFVLVVFAYRKLFHPAYKTLEFTCSAGIERGEFDEAFRNLSWQEFSALSRYGYMLKGVYIPAKIPTGQTESAPTAIFVHGITWTRFGMFKYMKSFIDRGWNVMAFDLVGHGATGPHGRFSPSYGYHEKYDVEAVVEEARETFPGSRIFGLVGESLGAASVLQYSGLPEARVSFVVADCPFSSGLEQLDARLASMHVPYFVRLPVVVILSALARVARGVPMAEASSMRAVLSTDLPVLFVHGLDDYYVPFSMSIDMYNARKKAGRDKTRLLLVAGARHAKSWNTDPRLWERTVFDFIEEYLDKD